MQKPRRILGDYQTCEMRILLTLAMTGLQKFGYDHQLQAKDRHCPALFLHSLIDAF